MKRSLVLLVLLGLSSLGRADTYQVDGKTFESKALAIRYVVNSGKRLEVTETRCMIVTNKFSLKACPKNKSRNFESEQFESLSKAN